VPPCASQSAAVTTTQMIWPMPGVATQHAPT
jgi:hypothetical protein